MLSKYEFLENEREEVLNSDGEVTYTFNSQKDKVQEFMKAITTAHNCIADNQKESVKYQGQSPDEVALIEYA